MSCEKVQSLLDPLLDNELPTETVATMMEHLNTCPDCQDDWVTLLSLRTHLQEYAKSIPLPTEGIARIESRIRKEDSVHLSAWTRRLSHIAAVLVLLLGAGFALSQLMPSEKFHLPATARTLASNYQANDVQAAPISATEQLKQASKHLEFKVNVLKITGWRLVSVDVLHLPKTACIAQLTYLAMVDGKQQKLLCYQSCSGRIKPDGLNEHTIGGHLVCCGQIDGMSLVYWPGDGVDHLLISTIPEKQLMALALGV